MPVTVENAVRLFHVAVGGAALILGPIAMSAPKKAGLHPRVGTWYFAAVTMVCASAAALATMQWPRNAFFLPIAVGTYAFALPGYLAARRRGRSWLLVHVVGQTSSYVAIATAFIVNNIQRVPGLQQIPFSVRALVPMFIGSCAVTWFAYQVYHGNRPR